MGSDHGDPANIDLSEMAKPEFDGLKESHMRQLKEWGWERLANGSYVRGAGAVEDRLDPDTIKNTFEFVLGNDSPELVGPVLEHITKVANEDDGE